MKNFTFHNPTKIIFGRETISRIGAETEPLGSNVLVVTGQQSSRRSGTLDMVLSSLRSRGMATTVLEGVVSNPVLSKVHKGIELARMKNVDVIVAVGGGSVLDSAKAIAVGVPATHDVWDFYLRKEQVRSSLPVLSVLTLAATGSEANGGSVITNVATRQKYSIVSRHCFPKASILDPTTTFSVSPAYSAYGAVDAVTHVLEPFFNNDNDNSSLQDGITFAVVRAIQDALAVVLTQPQDYDARSTLMWSATLALNGITSAGMGRTAFPVHMIEHSLSALYDIPHGAGLAIIMPGWLQYCMNECALRIAQFGQGVYSIHGSSTDAVAEETVQTLMEWYSSIGVPSSLAGWGIPSEDISVIARNASELALLWDMPEYTPDVIEQVLSFCI